MGANHDDDMNDELNSYYTVRILSFLAISLCAYQFLGAPIQCWVPGYFNESWEQYVESYCFAAKTYYVPMADDSIPTDIQKLSNTEISYYQWAPWILALQALFFYAPRLLLRTFNWHSGIDASALVTEAVDVLDQYRRPDNFSFPYPTVKLLHIVNALGQFLLVNSLLGRDCWLGIGFNQSTDCKESGHFPRVTMCDLQIRNSTGLYDYTVQCLLKINLFNEMVFAFLWWWFLLVISFTCLDLFCWLVTKMKGTHQGQFNPPTYLKSKRLQWPQAAKEETESLITNENPV